MLPSPVKPLGWPLGGKAWGLCLPLIHSLPSPYPFAQVLIQFVEWSHAPATAYPICFVSAAPMSLLPIRVQFHLYVYVVPPTVSVPATLPYLFYVASIPSRVTPSTLATPSLFPPSYFFLSAFVQSSCGIVSSSPLLPKIISPQVSILWTCSLFLPLHYQQSSSFLYYAPIWFPLLLLLS